MVGNLDIPLYIYQDSPPTDWWAILRWGILRVFHHANDSTGINRPSLDDCHKGDQKARLTLPRHLLLTDAKSPAALFVTSSTSLSPTALSDDRYLA